MRRRVFGDREGPASAAAEIATGAAPADALLKLSPRDLALSGFIDSRGLVVIAAAFGLLYELGLIDGFVDRLFGEQASGRGLARDVLRSLFAGDRLPVGRIALMLGAFVALLGFMRLLSMAWAVIRLYGFTITRIGDDLRTEYGLLTRVVATIPIKRIQTLTIREGPLHRLFGRASVRVDTAGGDHNEAGGSQREWLAPIIAQSDLPRFLHEVLPEVDLTAVEWRGVAPRAIRRAFLEWLVVAAFIAIPLAFWPTLVGSRRHRAAHRLGGARRTKNDRSPELGHDGRGRDVPERLALASGERRPVRQDPGGDDARITVRSAHADAACPGGHGRSRRRFAPRGHPVPAARDGHRPVSCVGQ